VLERRLTLISNPPDRPHEVVAGASELVVDVAGVDGTEESLDVDDGGVLSGGVAGLDATRVVGAGIGVSHDPCQSQMFKR
jgi:hypothetical protein